MKYDNNTNNYEPEMFLLGLALGAAMVLAVNFVRTPPPPPPLLSGVEYVINSPLDPREAAAVVSLTGLFDSVTATGENEGRSVRVSGEFNERVRWER